MIKTLSPFEFHDRVQAHQTLMRYFPFTKPVFQHQFGIRALPNGESIVEATDRYQNELELKRKLLSESPAEYFRALPESAQAQRDAAILICTEAPFIAENSNVNTDEAVNLSHECENPLYEIARHVQEDLAIVSGDPKHGFRLIAGAITFPSGWSIVEKIGLSMLNVHAPVPAYEAKLHAPTEKLLERIVQGRPVCRLNWGVRPSPQLDQSPKHQQKLQAAQSTINAANAGQRCWLRVERQTLARLTPSNDVLFAIHTHQERIRDLSNTQQEMLLGVLQTCPDETLAYKGILPIRTAVLDYLLSRPST